jgi:hypothetical protein
MLPRKLAIILLLAFWLFTFVATSSQCLCSQKPLFTVIIAPKRKSSDAGSASKPKRSHDILSIRAKVKILYRIEIGKKFICGYCQAVWQERIYHSLSDEEQRTNFIALSSLED